MKTASSKSSGHRAKKSSGGGLVNSFLGFCGKKLNHAKKAIKKNFKKVCTTANRIKKNVKETVKTYAKKAVSVVKSAGKAIVKFKQEHPILTGAIIIGAAGVLTLATGGLATGALATAISGACSGAFVGSVLGAGAGATIGFVDGLISGKGLKGALNEAAQGFGSGALNGAVSGGFAGGLGVGVGAQRAIRTLGNTFGDLSERAINGEKITVEDAVLSFGINAAFNYGGPKVFNKVKNTKAGQWVEKNISKGINVVKDKAGSALSAVKGKVGNAFSTVKEKVSGKLAGAGAEAVNVNSAASGVGRKTDFYAGSKGIATSLEEYDQFVGNKGQIVSGQYGTKSKWWHEGYVDDLSDIQIILGVKQSDKGLSTLGSSTRQNAMSAGKAWVGESYSTITDNLGGVIGYSSSDGTRAFRIQYKNKDLSKIKIISIR